MAVANYRADKGHYPPAYIADENGNPMHSWRVLVLPYMEEQELFDRYDFTQPWNSAANLRLATDMPAVFAFHGERRPTAVTTNYLAVIGEDTFWPGGEPRAENEIADEPSTTIMFVENLGEEVHWMEPRDLHVESMSFQVNDPRGVSSKYTVPAVAMIDGSLRSLEEKLPEDVFRAMLTVSGKEQIEAVGASWRILTDGRLRDEPRAKLHAQD